MPQNKESVEDKELKRKQKKDKKEDLTNKVVRVFDDVLDKDEQILKSYKPLKLSVYLSNLLKPFFVYLLFVLIFAILYVFPTEELSKKDLLVFLIFISGFTFLIELVVAFTTKRYLKNSYFVVTNKRIFVSYGFFDINFYDISFENIKDVVLKYNIFDKLLIKKSGQIHFYQAEKNIKDLLFFSIERPLDAYIEIQNILEEYCD